MIDTTEKPTKQGYGDSAAHGAELAEKMANRLKEDAQDAPGSTLGREAGLDHYRIVRYYRDEARDSEIVETGLTLGEARAHCTSPASREPGEWFDGYEVE